ncbi:MAG: hypothetical protein QNK92_13960 [Amylibacter sp.]
MMRRWIASGVLASIAGASMAQEDCGQTYVLKEGDTLLSVAQEYYQDCGKWSVIY